jgi:hypothetical protein
MATKTTKDEDDDGRYFFLSVYGGGPAIVSKQSYQLHEVREDHRVRIKEEPDSDEDDHNTPQQKQQPTNTKPRKMPKLEDGIVGL